MADGGFPPASGLPRSREELRRPQPVDAEIGRRIRALREARRLSLAEVATRLGKSVGFASQVERGLSSLAVRDLARVAALLEVGLVELIEPAVPEGPSSPIRRRAETQLVPFHGQSITKRALAPSREGGLKLFEMRLQPGASSGKELFSHEGEEAGVVQQGSLVLTIGDQTYVLEAGDAFRFNSRTPHGYANLREEEAVILWVNGRG